MAYEWSIHHQSNPVLIGRVTTLRGLRYTVTNEGGDTLCTPRTYAGCEKWCKKNGCMPVESWKQHHAPRPAPLNIPEGCKIHRVFVTRHYICCRSVEVIAKSSRAANRKAESVARKLWPDVRAAATDNGWIGDHPSVTLDRLGQSASHTFPVRLVAPGCYVDASPHAFPAAPLTDAQAEPAIRAVDNLALVAACRIAADYMTGRKPVDPTAYEGARKVLAQAFPLE